MNRRRFLAAAGALGLGCAGGAMTRSARAALSRANLLSAPLQAAGDWHGSLPGAAAQVMGRMREVSLAGVRLLSDRQPERLRVEDHAAGPPAVWLHGDRPRTAWLIVDIGQQDWCKLAYQFGHELGHVLCNSWQRQAVPRLPSQWLEESLVEAFSIRGLRLLADSWAQNPPFPGDSGFGRAIRDYRRNLVRDYARDPTPNMEAAAWLRMARPALESDKLKWGGPGVLGILALYESDGGSIEDLGAVNRWPERSGIPLEAYLARWQKSCAEIGAVGRLPGRVRKLFGLG